MRRVKPVAGNWISTGVLIAAGLALGACANVDEIASPGFSGPTGKPIPAFANMKAGSEEDFIMNVGRRTYFKAGSSTLDGTAKRTLDMQAEWLAQHPKWKIKLQGHADDPSNNKRLSTERAEAVMNYLVTKGVDRERMWAKGYSRERLVRDCPEIVCKSQNRRVVSNLREKLEDHVIEKRRRVAQQAATE
ncbi:MAG: OmpA family protein [Pseudomonadota bacterium]